MSVLLTTEFGLTPKNGTSNTSYECLQQADVKANDVVDNNTDDSQSNKEIIDTFETQRRHMGNLRSRSDSRVKAVCISCYH